MAWTDKVSAISGAISAVMTVVVPVAAYYWLDPAVQRAKLLVPLLISEQVTNRDSTLDGRSASSFMSWTIINPGELHAQGVLVRITSSNADFPVPDRQCAVDGRAPEDCVSIARQYVATFATTNRNVNIALSAPIPPHGQMTITLYPRPSRIPPDWNAVELVANSQAGPAITLSGSNGGSW